MLNETNLIQLSDSHQREELSYLKDGLYFAEEPTYSDEGWRNTVTFEIKDKLITKIEFNAVDHTAKMDKRILSQTGELLMDSTDQTSLAWHEQIEKLESYILAHQDVSSIHITDEGKTNEIPKVTIKIKSFLDLIQTALLNGPIEKGSFQDGHYYAEQENFTDGYKSTINLIVANGYIIAANWDNLTENGILMSEQPDNKIESWSHQSQLLENYLIEIQDPTQITFNEDNKTDTIAGVTIEVNPFIQLAIDALAQGPIIN